MNINNKLDDIFNSKLKGLTEKEQLFFIGLKNKWETGYRMIKPLLIAVAMFYIFNRLKNTLGYQDTIFILLVLQVVFLRHLISKF